MQPLPGKAITSVPMAGPVTYTGCCTTVVLLAAELMAAPAASPTTPAAATAGAVAAHAAPATACMIGRVVIGAATVAGVIGAAVADVGHAAVANVSHAAVTGVIGAAKAAAAVAGMMPGGEATRASVEATTVKTAAAPGIGVHRQGRKSGKGQDQ
ncbi:MAG: hypothetical protein R3F36_07480 [Candidatus Competibacteraceae bacterium]